MSNRREKIKCRLANGNSLFYIARAYYDKTKGEYVADAHYIHSGNAYVVSMKSVRPSKQHQLLTETDVCMDRDSYVRMLRFLRVESKLPFDKIAGRFDLSTLTEAEYDYVLDICTATTYEGDNKGEMEMAKETLYEVKQDDTTVFATKLAVTSAGQWVMEPKGGGAPFAVDKSACVEVLPYTVDVTFNGGDQHYSFFATAGSVVVGDVVVLDNYADFAMVRAVDTKSRRANAWLAGTVLKGSRIEAGE